ncbi:MAG: MarR family transcriptional regulator, partial [Firmicutes bacterium]|nr:MarR family transcriptional regulator [Bacillota bacterium]
VDAKGVTMTQMRILVELKHHGERTVGEIGTAIGSAPGNSSAMCKTLEKMGLVSRTRNPEDERIVLIDMTSQGRSLLKEIDDELTAICNPILAEYSNEDYEQIMNGVNKLQEIMDSLHDAFDRTQRR